MRPTTGQYNGDALPSPHGRYAYAGSCPGEGVNWVAIRAADVPRPNGPASSPAAPPVVHCGHAVPVMVVLPRDRPPQTRSAAMSR